MCLEWINRDGRIILFEKAVRTIPYGFLGVLFAIYLRQLGFDLVAIGVVLALTTLSSAFYSLIASLVADRVGRRRTLVFFALTDALAGGLLLLSTSWWAPVAAGIVGNMSVGTGEVGPYLSLEQAILPNTSDPKHRTLSFSLYNLTGYAASSAGSLLAAIPQYSGSGPAAYRPLFLAYLFSGLLGAVAYSTLSNRVERTQFAGERPPVLSEASKPIVLKLSALFAVDSFGGGFIVNVIVSLYFFTRYSLDLASLGLLFSATQIVTAFSFLVAARIAKRIGLLKTMVFSHIPSNILLALIPLASIEALAVALLLLRQSLSQMDVPTRQSYVMGVVRESDRTLAAGITNVSRSFAGAPGQFLAGLAMSSLWLGAPFIIAGCLKVAYDLSFFRIFRKTKPFEES